VGISFLSKGEKMKITAQMVKELRIKTDAPMMECKKALTQSEGDMDEAEKILRVRLGKKASKAATRVAAEGIVAIHISEDKKMAVALELNCETDFVAKNADFLAFGDKVSALIASANPADVAALNGLELEAGQTVEQVRIDLVGKIGENLTVRRFNRIEAKGQVTSYVHGTKIGVLLDLVDGDETLGKDIAMHIAATKPMAMDASGVDAELIEKERAVAAAKAAASGKPEKIVTMMVEGSVAKFLKEVTLLTQPFVKDSSLTIAELLKSKGAEIANFGLILVGEGIEVETTDFASEVAAQQAAAAKA
jgi:elongation factor Ts